MMSVKWLLHQLLRGPQRFPIEAALGVLYFVIAILNIEKVKWLGVSDDILYLYVPLVVLTFWLQRVNRIAYYASFFLSVLLLCVNIQPFLWTSGFFFTYVLAAILLIVGSRRMDNHSFVTHAIHVAVQMFFGLLITGILTLAVLAIVSSFLYIFGIKAPNHLYEYILLFIWIVLAPQICCTLIRQGEDEVKEPAKIMQIIFGYILSPAVIIYTIILYLYFLKIVFEWELPKGGVAWMVMGFISVALAGRMSQTILSQRYYDWFYRHFTFIAVPPLILYWVGSIYRIRLYSFTEDRFYLIVAGVLMTVFVLMLFKHRTRRYQLMALIFGAAIIIFTYIPGISAKSIGLSCQKQRLKDYLSELKLTDVNTGKLLEQIDLMSIRRDSLMCEKYRDVCSVIDYVREGIGADEFKKKYGNWTYNAYNFNYDKGIDYASNNYGWHERKEQIELGDYSTILPAEHYTSDYKDGVFIVKSKDDVDGGEGEVVVEYPLNAILQQDSTCLQHPDRLMSYRNDSLMLVLESICIRDNAIPLVSYNFLLFKKSRNTAK
ncbi:MAG: DUF4153 domain-containing protein [Bacteroidaceae bacterium]|nr:DUF4153 domain-containing protein [Bacteroidaceae bacterium]